MAAAQARTKEMEAGRTPWYRPGLRDRRLAEAAELQARAERAQTTAAHLERERTELHEQTAKLRTRKRTTVPICKRPANRDRARLAELRDQIGRGTRSADTTGIRRDELTAEHQLRTEMPPDQAATENNLRTQWLREQQLAEQQRAAQQQQEALDRSRNYHYDHGQDHGFGLGL